MVLVRTSMGIVQLGFLAVVGVMTGTGMAHWIGWTC